MPTEVGTAEIKITPDFDSFGKDVDQQMKTALGPVGKNIDDEFSKAGTKASGGFLGTMKSGLMPIAGIVGGAFAGAAVLEFGSYLLEVGTQVDAWRVKVDTVFGDQAATVQSWASSAAGAMGLTGDELAGLAASFGDLLVPMGFTREQAALMSQDTLELAGALSAWSGGQRSAAEVADILSSAMLGERDALKGLGISISAADVEAKKLEMAQQGLKFATDEQATAAATQQLITEKSTDAQKAWADGSMDATKKQNELKAKLAEVTETLAEKLMPVALSFTTWLVDEAIPWVEDFAEQWGPLIEGVVTFALKAAEMYLGFQAGIREIMVPIIATLVDTFLGAVEMIIGGAASAFGWVPGVGDKLKRAARAVEDFRDDANRALSGIRDKNVRVTVEMQYHAAQMDQALINRFKPPGRANGGPVSARQPYMVGERGPELYVPTHSGTIISNEDLKTQAGGTVVNVNGPVFHERLDVDEFANRLSFSMAGGF